MSCQLLRVFLGLHSRVDTTNTCIPLKIKSVGEKDCYYGLRIQTGKFYKQKMEYVCAKNCLNYVGFILLFV